MIEAVIAFLVEVAVKSTLLLLLAGLAAWAVRRGPAALRHRIWCSALAGIALLPLVMVAMPRLSLPLLPAEPTPMVVSAVKPVEQAPLLVANAPVVAPESEPTPWSAMLFALYFVGAFASAMGVVFSLWRLRGVARRSIAATERQHRLLDAVAGVLGIKPPVLRVAHPDGPTVPMTWGARRPVVLLPRSAEAWSEVYLRSALAHESAHIRRGDWAVQMAARAVCIFYWFHPLARWAAARLRIEAERASDDLVLLSGIHAADYAACLLEVTRMNRDEIPDRRLVPAALPMAQTTALAERLRAVLDADAQRREHRRGIGMVIGAVALSAVVVTGALQATPSQPSITRTTVQVAPKSKAALQSQAITLRARLRSAEAEVRRLRALNAPATTSRPGMAAPQADALRRDLELAESNRAVADAALAHAQTAADAARAQVEADSVIEGNVARTRVSAARADAERARLRMQEALKAQIDARAEAAKAQIKRKNRFERGDLPREDLRGGGNPFDAMIVDELGKSEAQRRAALNREVLKSADADRGAANLGGLPGGVLEGGAGGIGLPGGSPLGVGLRSEGRAPASRNSDSGGGRGERNESARSYDEERENLEDQARHLGLDMAVAKRRLERAHQRHKAGILPLDDVEEAELRLQHLELDRDIIDRKMKRLQASRARRMR